MPIETTSRRREPAPPARTPGVGARVLLLALCTACHHDAPRVREPGVPPTLMPDAGIDAALASPEVELSVELVISASSVTMAELGAITIGFKVRNLSEHPLDPRLATSELRVDGLPQRAWPMALLNSGHDRRWTALPAGDELTSRWRLGAALFPAPGAYTVELTIAGVTSQSVVVRVDP